MKNIIALALVLIASYTFPANAVVVEVVITGEVEFNQINSGALSTATSGDAASLVFRVDSNVFVDSATFPTRGYAITPGSFTFTAGGSSVGLADPLPPGTTPYFVLRNDDPAVDGFFTGTSVDGFPNGVPSDSTGLFGPFTPNFSVTYNNDPLASLDILGAVGTYDFSGLTVFGFTVDDGPFNAMGLIFEQMTITAVPIPAAIWMFGAGILSLAGLRRR